MRIFTLAKEILHSPFFVPLLGELESTNLGPSLTSVKKVIVLSLLILNFDLDVYAN